MIRAAGGVVVRERHGQLEVVVIHRPKYDDWTIPKGKLNRGETHEECAVREIEEETGLRCELGKELPSTSYLDANNRPKTVRYWLMEPVAGEMRPAHEVDDVRWVTAAEAEALLTYERDRALVRHVASS